MTIVTYRHRPKRPPRKKPAAQPLAMTIITTRKPGRRAGTLDDYGEEDRSDLREWLDRAKWGSRPGQVSGPPTVRDSLVAGQRIEIWCRYSWQLQPEHTRHERALRGLLDGAQAVLHRVAQHLGGLLVLHARLDDQRQADGQDAEDSGDDCRGYAGQVDGHGHSFGMGTGSPR
ncbi:MAG: hypothetical protein WDN25_09760 [Acetobacteraceae bacterium]